MTEPHYTVSEVARLAHVSVRTLHHYDDIGLLTPGQRTAAGYRLYGHDDLRRLIAERHRQHITRWFYDCGPTFHAGLADMFANDPRFAQTFENHGEGLAAFAAASIRANAARQGGASE